MSNSAMFEFLVPIMTDGTDGAVAPNVRYPIDQNDITEAETRLGFSFPPQLRAFFTEIGSGFLTTGMNSAAPAKVTYINRFLDPDEVATLYLKEDDELVPSEGFGAGEIPFFEVGDRLY